MITIEKAVYTLLYILKENAPVRTHPLGAIKYSPYPGNLKNNGIVSIIYSPNSATIRIGGEPAPYAPYTETRSKKPHWQENSIRQGTNRIAVDYKGRVEWLELKI